MSTPLTPTTLAVRGVSDVVYSSNSSTGGWFRILGGTHEKDCVLFMSRLKIVSGLPYKIVIESWNKHASSSHKKYFCGRMLLEPVYD